MKKFLILFLIGVSFQNVFADELAYPETPEKNWKIGGQVASYRYVEPGLISHSGFLIGASAEGFSHLSPTWKGIFFADALLGKLNYDGAVCDVNTEICSDYSSKTNDFILRLSYRFEYALQDNIHLFVGPGVRYLVDKGDESVFYTRVGTYFFLPIGANYDVELGGDSSLQFDFEYDVFLAGRMHSQLSDVNSTYGDIDHQQSSGSGHKITVNYLFNKKDENPLTLGLFYENWTVGASNAERLYINGAPTSKVFTEPKNFSESLGLKLLITL